MARLGRQADESAASAILNLPVARRVARRCDPTAPCADPEFPRAASNGVRQCGVVRHPRYRCCRNARYNRRLHLDPSSFLSSTRRPSSCQSFPYHLRSQLFPSSSRRIRPAFAFGFGGPSPRTACRSSAGKPALRLRASAWQARGKLPSVFGWQARCRAFWLLVGKPRPAFGLRLGLAQP